MSTLLPTLLLAFWECRKIAIRTFRHIFTWFKIKWSVTVSVGTILHTATLSLSLAPSQISQFSHTRFNLHLNLNTAPPRLLVCSSLMLYLRVIFFGLTSCDQPCLFRPACFATAPENNLAFLLSLSVVQPGLLVPGQFSFELFYLWFVILLSFPSVVSS